MSVQQRPDELIRLLRPEFAGRTGADSPASLTWGKIMLIPPAGAPVTTYPVTVAGLLAALTAATVAGSMIWVPPGSFNTAITIPANIALVALGEKVSINGQWTLNSGVVVANVVQTQSGSSAGALSGVVGPSSGIAYMKNCSINVENSGAGDAYAVNQNVAGDLWLWGCATYGNATGGGSGFGVRQSAGNVYTTRDGRHRGSTGKFSGTVQLFDIDDVIHLKTSTFTQLYNSTAAGVAAMIAGASSGDRAEFPRHIQIAMTSGITIPAGVTFAKPNLSFSGFASVGVDMSAGSRIEDFNIDYDGTGQATATGIRANSVACSLARGNAFARNATTSIGMSLLGAGTGTDRVTVAGIYGNAQNATTGYGVLINGYVTGSEVTGEVNSTTASGVRFNITTLANDDIIVGGWGLASGTTSYGIEVVASKFGRATGMIAYGGTNGVYIGSGGFLEAGHIKANSVGSAGTGAVYEGIIDRYDNDYLLVRKDVVQIRPSNVDYTKLLLIPDGTPSAQDTAIHIYNDRDAGGGLGRGLFMGASHGVPELLIVSADETGNANMLPLRFIVEDDQTPLGGGVNVTEAARIDPSGMFCVGGNAPTLTGSTLALNVTGAGKLIIFEGTAGGGGEGIAYQDSVNGIRYGLLFPGSDVVALANRASNGVVQIRANTSTAGAGGEITVAEFQDSIIIDSVLHQINVEDAITTTPSTALQIQHKSTGTPAAGFGVRLHFLLESSTTVDRDAGLIVARWATATDASRKSRLDFYCSDNAGNREFLRGESNGSAAMIGFYGGAAAAKQTVSGSRGGNAALASLLTALATIGLITDSSS